MCLHGVSLQIFFFFFWASTTTIHTRPCIIQRAAKCVFYTIYVAVPLNNEHVTLYRYYRFYLSFNYANLVPNVCIFYEHNYWYIIYAWQVPARMVNYYVIIVSTNKRRHKRCRRALVSTEWHTDHNRWHCIIYRYRKNCLQRTKTTCFVYVFENRFFVWAYLIQGLERETFARGDHYIHRFWSVLCDLWLKSDLFFTYRVFYRLFRF